MSNNILKSVGAGSSTRFTTLLESLQFDNKLIRELPIDSETRIFARKVQNCIFSKVHPTAVVNPQLISFSPAALSLLGLPSSKSGYMDLPANGSPSLDSLTKSLERYFSGNAILPGSDPMAHVYCGHQFGSFSGQLGDGAAILLGEVSINIVDGKIPERWEIQLKGAGPTPFSRGSDGRKVLRSSVREFLCSEAMYGLGIATTRAGTVITSDSRVVR